jgi:hypothetical protein
LDGKGIYQQHDRAMAQLLKRKNPATKSEPGILTIACQLF